ncbi:MAG: [FeFe] hydrogenase H-cluster maturation GTPase HydF, partial [Oscillospiraceae bacterium]|nr:[FeFe] hydrogenase H-cluster maturation GTPase HydF [Oscillospiraceae bacterium]
GRVNSGKSSLMNAITGQNSAIVSANEGTTTDPVRKAIELLPIGAVMLYDTAGFGDVTGMGSLRIKKTQEILRKTDLALLAVDSTLGMGELENTLTDAFNERNIQFITVFTKCDLADDINRSGKYEISVSTKTGEGIDKLKEMICSLYLEKKTEQNEKTLTQGLVKKCGIAVLVTPIDESAPKGRLILPQVQAIRSLLDGHAITITVQPSELEAALNMLNKAPDIVITDSQAFSFVKDIVPENVPLTSFSILFAGYKGILTQALEGIKAMDKLQNGDRILISEGCTHHRQCGDIGKVKIPAWIEKHTKKKFLYEFSSGGEFPEDLSRYSLIVHCGGCMLSKSEMSFRRKKAAECSVPFTNYGVLIAAVNGILSRCTKLTY